MKKNINELIEYYSGENDAVFRDEAYKIVRNFDASGEHKLSELRIALIDNLYTVYTYFEKFFSNLKG